MTPGPRFISASQVAAQAWRSGGGRTRELLAWPSSSDWTVRISLADIDGDGPFSAFPGVQRWFAVVEGAGVALSLGTGDRVVVRGDAPLQFDAAEAPDCRLLVGPTRDLNLMLRDGHGAMRQVQPGEAWAEPFAMRGLFTVAAGRWSGDGEPIDVAKQTLLWTDDANADRSPWTFVAADAEATVLGWWLGYTPHRFDAAGAHR